MKNNNKSIRLTDEVYNYIINFEGDGFNNKFENIILYAMESEADRKKKIEELDEVIEFKKQQISGLVKKVNELRCINNSIEKVINTVLCLEREVNNL